MDIKIFVSHTPDQNTVCLRHPLLYNVIAGSDFQTKEVPEGVYQDNQGENISGKNKSYCELTTQYWAWKNMQADYFGFCHYRRLFSFIQKSDKPMEYYNYLDGRALQELRLDEAYMQEFIGQHDFLIAKGVPVELLNAGSVYEQYADAPKLRIEDADILLQVIQEKYPGLYQAAEEYFDGQVCYHCNMFIAKNELFQEYSKILFDILGEVEKRADRSEYSREGHRTIGHLGERMAGIYYRYLQKQKKYRLGELQRAFFHHADAQMELPKPENKETVPVVLAANQKYVPVLYVCAQSIAEQAVKERMYEIYIFHTDIPQESCQLFLEKLSRKNVHFTFVDVSKRAVECQPRAHITAGALYRFLILDILKNYEKAVYLDCDTIVCRDIAQLYDTEIGNNLIAAVLDAEFAGRCCRKDLDLSKYCTETLGLREPFSYFQTGVLVLHISELRKTVTVQQLLETAETDIYRFSDRDVWNAVCKGRVEYLDMSWNVITDSGRRKEAVEFAPYAILDAYEQARREPYIIHYAGSSKPWLEPDGDYAHVFWETARRTIFYEQLLKNLFLHVFSSMPKQPPADSRADGRIEARHFKLVRKILMKALRKESKLRRMLGKAYWKVFG